MSFVSYAQNFEDVLLHRVFGGQETGFYVDVGAYHPVIGSTTKAFYDRGWSGINIEPGSIFAELAAARPRDVNLQIAVMDQPGEVVFQENEADRGMSHVVGDGNAAGEGRMVACDTLEAIVRTHARNRPVDFIKIDAEGAETAIVRSTNWRVLRPRVLLLEATLPWSSMLANQDWEPILLEQGYVRSYFDGINCFYVPEEETAALSRYFRVPVNVLDRVIPRECDELRAALSTQQLEVHRLTAEHNAVQAAKQQEVTQLAAERDALRIAMEQETSRLTAERDAMRATMDQQIAQLVAERDAARAAMEQETARLAAERDAAQAEANRFAAAAREQQARSTVSAPVAVTAVAPTARSVARKAAVTVYRLVRPVVRPLAWRLRGFLTSGLAEQLAQLNARMAATPALLTPALTATPSAVYVTNNEAPELRRLAAEMERALLTLALERTPTAERSADTGPVDVSHPTAETPTSNEVALRLPRGRTTTIKYAHRDLSVGAPLLGSGGDWEPHVRQYLETVIQPDWVCMDIGANIGAHTLSMAVLADAGRVVAFEADPANFQLLSHNAAALPATRATIDLVNVALWDSQGTLVCGGADELAGCSFVAEDQPDRAAIEQRLRTVVASEAINNTGLHMRHSVVSARPLDLWVEDHPLPRLNLVKLDVEGAELHVVRGAAATLRRYQPIMVVEYNPACAEAYFGQPPDALFHELAARFDHVSALEPDGSLTAIPDWTTLQARLTNGKGWEDLVCQSAAKTLA